MDSGYDQNVRAETVSLQSCSKYSIPQQECSEARGVDLNLDATILPHPHVTKHSCERFNVGIMASFP